MGEDNLVEMYLNNVWRPNCAITGAGGLPPIATAGNVVRPATTVRLSMRLPPTFNPAEATKVLEEKLLKNVPSGAKVTLHGGHEGQGFCMKDLDQWLIDAIETSGSDFFDGKKAQRFGSGGSIPFLGLLMKMYPGTQIIPMGLIGPGSNCHAPNECIDLTFAKKTHVHSLAHDLGRWITLNGATVFIQRRTRHLYFYNIFHNMQL